MKFFVVAFMFVGFSVTALADSVSQKVAMVEESSIRAIKTVVARFELGEKDVSCFKLGLASSASHAISALAPETTFKVSDSKTFNSADAAKIINDLVTENRCL